MLKRKFPSIGTSRSALASLPLRVRLVLICSACVVMALLFASLVISVSIAAPEANAAYRDAVDDMSVLTPVERTEASAAEHVSMIATQWNYFRHLNAQLFPSVFEQYLSTGLSSILKLSPFAWGTTLEDVPGLFLSTEWAKWYDRFWEASSVGYQGVKPMLTQLCSKNVMLQFAPWCGWEKDTMSEWLMDNKHGSRFASSRVALKHEAAAILANVSQVSHLNGDDKKMISDIKWADWDAPVLRDAAALRGDAPAGSVFLRRTSTKYPVLLALRKSVSTSDLKSRYTQGTFGSPFDSNKKLRGFHACMFGSRRNLSQTVDRLQDQFLRGTRPQRFHVVTSADGQEEYAPPETNRSGVVIDEESKRSLTPEAIAEMRHKLFNSFTEIVFPFADTFLAVERNLATSRHNCVICRGFLPREMCRASILSDLERGIPVEMVMIFRPDMHMWNPIVLNPYIGRQGEFEVTPEEMEGDRSIRLPSPSRREDPVVQWRLQAKPQFSLVIDHGFLPTTFAVINDVNVTKSTIVVHCRVTYPLDLHWIGDPVVLGHWHVMNHWLECFSVITGSSTRRLIWTDDNAGETHHALFYRYYMRPLFELGVELGLTEPLDIRLFDFQFSLFRSDPITNAQLMVLGPNYVAYQQQTIFRRFATKWDSGECMRYYFTARQYNVSSFYVNPRLFFFGEIGRIKMVRMPMRLCLAVRSPPGLQTCFAQYQKVVFYKKGKNIHNPCKPYCGVFPLLLKEGMCAHVGNKGPRQRYISTFSTTPMFRNESGEVLRFNLVNPQYVRGDTLWFEKMKLREDARKRQEDAAGPSQAPSVAASDPGEKVNAVNWEPQRGSDADPGDNDGGLGSVKRTPKNALIVADGDESFTRPPQAESDAPKEGAKKSQKRYRFVRGNRNS